MRSCSRRVKPCEVAANEAYVFTVTRGTHGSPWVHGFVVEDADVTVKVSADRTIESTPDTARVSLVAKPESDTRTYVGINGMWCALMDTASYQALDNLNGASEEHDGGRFCDNPHFGVDMYVPGVGAILWLILCSCAWYGAACTPCPERTTGRP